MLSTRELTNDDATAVTAPVSSARLIERFLAPVAAPFGFEIIFVEVAGGAGAKVLRIFLDVAADAGAEPSASTGAAQGGVTIGDCAKMSRMFSNALDAAEASADEDGETMALRRLLASPYTLEVSSPGLDRPLAKRAHFARYVGHRVDVKTHEPLEAGSNRRTYHATLLEVGVDPVTPDDPHAGIIRIKELDQEREFEIPLSSIRKANVVYEG